MPLAPPTLRYLLLLTVVSGNALVAQSRDWSPEERTVLADYSNIRAVAVSTERVFAVTRDALVAWNPLNRQWEGPWLPRDPGMLSDVRSALADPLDHSLWLIRRNGWVRFDPAIRFWEQGFVPGQVTDAALDRNNPAAGLFLRTTSGWYQAGRGGAAFPSAAPTAPVRPPTVQDAVRDNPAIQANSAGLLLNTRLRPVSYTSAARATGFSGEGWYLGTTTAGLVFFPLGSAFPQPMPFGLPSDEASAVFAGPTGVWVTTDRTPVADPSISYLARSLDSVHWYQGPRATGLPFATVRRIVGEGSTLWLATDQGLVRVGLEREEIDRFDRDLPDVQVLDLAQHRGRVAIGTAHGVAVYGADGGFQRLAPNFADAAPAVLLAGDTLWVGTRFGLWYALGEGSDLRRPAGWGDAPSQQDPVLDLVWRGDTLVALTADRLLWRDPKSGSFTLGPTLGGALGRLHTLVSTPGALYLGGSRGLGVVRLNGPLLRRFTTPGDLPGELTDLAADGEFLWVATRRGLVRFQLDAIGR